MNIFVCQALKANKEAKASQEIKKEIHGQQLLEMKMISQLIEKMIYSMNNEREIQKDYKRENSLLEHINCLLFTKKRFLLGYLGFTDIL